jgi:hypothetical protein
MHRDGRSYRFLTLTTKAGTRESSAEFQADWRKLKERLRRRGLMPGYIKVMETTTSGLLHAHIIMAGGGFLPQAWISKLWLELHGAEVVDIRLIRKRAGNEWWQGYRSVAGYLAKYMGKDAVARLAYSPKWLWPGLARTWRGCWRAGAYLGMPFEKTLAVWTSCCRRGIPPERNSEYLWIARRNPDLQRILAGEPAREARYTSWAKASSSLRKRHLGLFTALAPVGQPIQAQLFA